MSVEAPTRRSAEAAEIPSTATSDRYWRGAPLSLRAFALAVLPGLLFAAIFIVRSSGVLNGRRLFTLFDDTMISLTYGRTLADTGELVWYPGAPRVEGITNPAWTFLMAGLEKTGLSPSGMALALMLIGVLLLLASAWMAAWIARQLAPGSKPLAMAAAAITMLTYPLLFWTLRGMEVGAVAFLVLLVCVAAIAVVDDERPPRQRTRWLVVLAVASVLGVATRTDFVIVVLAVTTWLALTSSRDRFRRVLAVAIPTVAFLVLSSLARHAYYGAWVPNTYTLKVAGATLFTRLERGVLTSVKLIPIALIGALALVSVRRRRRDGSAPSAARSVSLLLAMTATSLVGYSMFVGGDAWEDMPNRYVVPALVLFGILGLGLAEAARHVSMRTVVVTAGAVIAITVITTSVRVKGAEAWIAPGRGVVTGLAMLLVTLAFVAVVRSNAGRTATATVSVVLVSGIVLAATSATGFSTWTRDGGAHVHDDLVNVGFGEALRDITEPTASIAVVWAGTIAYHAQRPMVDLLGKSDARVANGPFIGGFYPGHNKYDYAHSIGELRPDIVAQLAGWTTDDLRFIADAGYERFCLGLPLGDDVAIYVRDDSTLVDRSHLTPLAPVVAEGIDQQRCA